MNNIVYPVKRLSFLGSSFAVLIQHNPNGSFMFRDEHEKIINKLHEQFNLENMSFPTATVYRPVRTINGGVELLWPMDKNDFTLSDYPFVKVSEHDAIIGLIEKQIPIFAKEEIST